MKILVIDSNTERHFDEHLRKRCHDVSREMVIENGANLPSPAGFDIVFLHCSGIQSNWEQYCSIHGNQTPIVLFSGGDLSTSPCERCEKNINGEKCDSKEKVTFIPWRIENHMSFDWQSAFDSFKKGDKFPVQLLKPCLANICAFLILLQGYLAANLPKDDIKGILPGLPKALKTYAEEKRPETNETKWWSSVVEKVDLISDLKANRISISKDDIETFYKVPSTNKARELFDVLKESF
ncbi:MAG: hypothetical protein Q7J31_04490 [Syntrophales bacterium]|nr:hypothetical protein [Syntrophales bacterium]